MALAGCGVGCGGPMTAGGEAVSPLNIAGWRSFPLRERVAGHVGVDTWVDNDAKALALGEGWRGAAAGHRDYLAMVVSTGVGGGIVLDGRLLDGADGNAGHIGHVVVEPEGRPCVCGARGCLEAEASGAAIAAITGELAPARRPTTCAAAPAPSWAAPWARWPTCSTSSWRASAGSVALGFGAVFFDAAQAELDRTACIAHARGAVIRPGGLGADGPLVGAAAVAWRGLGHPVGVR